MNTSLAACLAFLPSCLALDGSRAVSQYQKRHWQIEDGLPHNYVNAIVHAPDGYLLVGTDEGLARFDGVRFTPVPLDRSLHLDRRWIMSLVPTGQGYWTSTYDGAIYRIAATGAVEREFHLTSAIHGLFEDSHGDLWFDSGGIHRIHHGQLERVAVPGSNHFGGSWAIFSEGSNGIWIARNTGLYQWNAGKIERVIEPTGGQGQVLSVLSGRDGSLWAGTSNGLYKARGTALVRQPGVDGPVSALLRDRSGVLWAGTWGKGLCRLTTGPATCWTSEDGISDDFIRTLYEDREGNLWFGSRSGGLNRWRDTIIQPIGIPEGLRGNFASAVAGDKRGDLWLGTYRSGLYRLAQGMPVALRTPIPRLDMVISSLAGDAAGAIWIGSWHGLYRYSDRGGYTDYTGQLPGSCVGPKTVAFDDANHLWLGCTGGLFRYESTVAVGATQIVSGKSVGAILAATDGTLWAGTSSGLVRIGSERAPETISGLADPFIRYISEDSRHRIWATTQSSGLYLIAGGKARALDRRHGLPSHPLYKVLDDGSGNLWLSSSRGLLRLEAGQVDEWVAGKRDRLDVSSYDVEDGMRSIECHGVAQPGGWRHTDGSLWFPTVKGFVRIVPRQRDTLPAPQVLVESVQPGARLEPGSGDLEVGFTALRFGAPGHLRFRYRLDNETWIDAGANRTVRFHSLAPGSYRLQIAARDGGADWSPQAAELTIEQLPRFQQTLLFKLLSGAFLLGMAVLAYRWRITTLRGRYAAVVMERNRIAREWHDTLLAGLSGLAWQLEAARKRPPELAAQAIDVARKMVDHCQSEARRVIWDLRDGTDPSAPLSEAISSFLDRQREGRPIDASVETLGPSAAGLPHDLELNALRVGQEAIVNAVRHAAATQIRVVLEYTAKQLMLRVSDDGKGFTPEQRAETAGHFGILGMRERVLNFGGRFHLTSSPGNGTVVEAVFPIQAEGS